MRKLLQLIKATWTYQHINPEHKDKESKPVTIPGTAPTSAVNSARGTVMLNVGTQHKTVMPTTSKLMAGDLLLRQAGLSTFSRGHSRATSIEKAVSAGKMGVDLNVLHAVDSLATGGVSVQVLSQMFR